MSILLTKDTEYIMSKVKNLELALNSMRKIETAIETLKETDIHMEDSVFVNEYHFVLELLLPKYLTKDGVSHFYENIYPELLDRDLDDIMEELHDYIK